MLTMIEQAKTVRPRGAEEAKIIQVIETKALIGYGTQADPVRHLTQYWDFEGNLLAQHDSMEPIKYGVELRESVESECDEESLPMKAYALLGLKNLDIVEIEGSGCNPHVLYKDGLCSQGGYRSNDWLGDMLSGKVGWRKLESKAGK